VLATVALCIDVHRIVMCQPQRITLLAFNIHDGWRHSREQNLSEFQRRCMVRKLPSILQFTAYLYNFHQSVFRAVVPYRDYEEFVEDEQHRSAISSPKVNSALNVSYRMHLSSCFMVVTKVPPEC
jgi:hypothetical protein